MSSLGFDIGVRALLTAQSQLETIGHNLANASTPGYSRQTTLISAAAPQFVRGLMQGGGVQANAIRRAVDAVLHGRITTQTSSLARLDARIGTLGQVEMLLGGTGATGPASMLQTLFANIASLSSSPTDSVLRTATVQSAVSLTSRFNQLAGDVNSLSQSVASQIQIDVKSVNDLAQQISTLNREIVGAAGGSSSANDLRDLRDQALRELARYVDVRAVEDAHGAVRVLVGGRMLVSPTSVEQLKVHSASPEGVFELQIGGNDVQVSGGEIGGLLALHADHLPDLASNLDSFARNLIYETNRVHSTGVGADGPMQALRGAYQLSDQNGDGNVSDELLARCGLPFDVESGELYVNVTDRASGAIATHKLDIDARSTSVGDFLAALDALPNISAKLDGQQRVSIQADSGFGFDFAARLDASPDATGSFGGTRASLGSASAGPFAVSAGDTLDFSGNSGPFSVTLQAADFANIGAATAGEVADVLNNDAGFSTSGLIASVVAGALVVQSSATGSGETFTLTGGSALGAFGWSANTVVTGSDIAATPHITGTYTGASNGELVFRPNIDGRIGTTAGLLVEVFDANGNKLTELDVGPNYRPGDRLEVIDGVQVSFDYGALSASEHDVFSLAVVADSDSARVLPALGLNSFFTGVDAATIGVRSDIVDDPARLAASLSGAPGDAGNLLRMIDVQSQQQPALDGATLGNRISELVGNVAFELDSANGARETEQQLLDGLDARRNSVAGVNSDEELAHMLEQQQAYEAAAQFIRVVNDMQSDLLDII